jgi:DNA-binding response OmpR family regulator
LLATLLEDELMDNGYTVVGPFMTLAETSKAASGDAFDIALLDLNLRGELTFPVAEALVARAIPFIFLSGYGAGALPEKFKASPCLPKPYDAVDLFAAIERLAIRRS